jgi:hypothetical protein
MSTTLTREQLANVLGVTPRTIKEWTTTDLFPANFYTLTGRGQSSYEYSPRAAMIGQLVLELGDALGANSPLPRRIAEQVIAELDRLGWPESRAVITVVTNGFEIRVPLTFLKTAREKLAALTS